MSWIRVDDGFATHNKVLPLSDSAVRLWLMTSCWSRLLQNLKHEGKIQKVLLMGIAQHRYSARKLALLAEEMVEAKGGGLYEHGLWLPTDSGWLIHNWHKYGPDTTDPDSVSAKRSEAGKRGAVSRWQTDGKRHGKRMANGDFANGKSMPPVPVPVPGSDLPPLASLAPPWQEVLTAIANSGPFSEASEMHDAVDRLLRENNCEVSREFEVPDRGDGRRGFVDLVAKQGESLLALELDRGSPRVKSVFKLRQIEALRVVVLRSCSPGDVPIIPGITVICTRQAVDRDIYQGDLASFAPELAKLRAKKPRKSQWRRFPPDFEPDDSHRKLAAELGLNLAQQLTEIRDYEFAKPKSDPAATLRTWLRNAVKFGAGMRGPSRNQPKQPNGGSWKPNIERAE